MPFKSKAQQRKCYALKAQGKNGSWDCGEWSKETKDFKKLPEKAPKKAKKAKKVKKEENMMESTTKFVKFLNDIKTPDTKLIVESIQKAFAVCFESYYAGDDSYKGEEGEDTSGETPTGNTASNGGTGASGMNEDVSSDTDIATKELVVDAEKKKVAGEIDKVREAEQKLAAEKVKAAEEKLASEKTNLAAQSKI